MGPTRAFAYDGQWFMATKAGITRLSPTRRFALRPTHSGLKARCGNYRKGSPHTQMHMTFRRLVVLAFGEALNGDAVVRVPGFPEDFRRRAIFGSPGQLRCA